VLAVTPDDLGGRYIGVAGPHPAGAPDAFEVRGFFPVNGATAEDPVTGSLNASLAQWLLREGRAVAPFRNRQGTALGRHGVISVEQPDPQDDVWIGGRSTTCVTGVVVL
jgi:predicted PhzF superfamily epimerase YddE/YHI9